MNDGIISLSNKQLALTYILVGVVVFLTNINGVNRKKDILISVLRMTIQLFIAGFVLVFIFDTDSFIFPLGMFIIMEFFAIFNVIKSSPSLNAPTCLLLFFATRSFLVP